MLDISQLFAGKNYERYFKRPVDFFFSLVLLVFFLPICILIALTIKLSSRGSLFADVPERVGQNIQSFRMYKFRTMVAHAHELLRTDPRFKNLYDEYKKGSYKLRQDPRVTPIGRFLRKHSLDEVPQLINVIRGEMSLVGPRAYYPDELENQQEKYPETRKLVKKVLSVKPGITGLWQVSGRSEINFDKRIALDATYVENLSLWNDLQIILKTPLVMITGRGAI